MPPRPAATIKNRRARFEYLVLDTFEAGIMLEGAEVKSIREGKANLVDAYGAWLTFASARTTAAKGSS